MSSLDETLPVIPKVSAAAPSATSSVGGSAVSSSRHAEDVASLRDRLLREARQERLRVSQRFEESSGSQAAPSAQSEDFRPPPREPRLQNSSEASSQTEPVTISSTRLDLQSSPPLPWGPKDDAAQAEAIRTIEMMAGHKGHSGDLEQRIAHLEEQIQAERASRQELNMMLTMERTKREAVQGQVLTLEAEMDAKESTLQLAQDKLERRNADLQQVQKEVHTMQAIGGFGGSPSQRPAIMRDFMGTQYSMPQGNSIESSLEALRLQMREQDYELEQKDQHINTLLAQLRQQNAYPRGDEVMPVFDRGAGRRF
mmetsp:Transcript_29018/g.52856  ORF Transcript_29018/g.52856 Transcript_29018/m.52856 type:complete len:312 (-) Transcript_29018:138-1073(-)